VDQHCSRPVDASTTRGVLRRLTLGLAAPAVALGYTVCTRADPPLIDAGLWILPSLLLLAILVERFPADLQVRGSNIRHSGLNLVVVVQLFLLESATMLVLSLVATAAALVGKRRQHMAKALFNLNLSAIETSVSIIVFRLLLPADPDVGSPQVWLPVFAAIVAADATSQALLMLSVVLMEGRASIAQMLRSTLITMPAGVASGMVGMAFVVLYAAHPANVILFGASILAIVVSYRSFSTARRRLLVMSNLYELSAHLSSATHDDQGTTGVLKHVSALLDATDVELCLDQREETSGRPGSSEVSRLALSDAPPTFVPLSEPSDVLHQVMSGGSAQALTAQRATEAERAELQRHDAGSVLVVPLVAKSGVFGALSVARGFDGEDLGPADLAVLSTAASHIALWVEHGRMVERLRQSAADRERQALEDALTELPNRRMFNELAARVISAARARGGRGAVVLIDLDRFKDVNDTLGHAAGDALLKLVSKRLAKALPEGWSVARLGGDEFAVLIPNAAGEDARALTEILRVALQPTFEIDSIPVAVEGSFGVAYFPDDGDDISLVLRRADVAMYSAKASGRQVERYTQQADTNSRERLAMLADLRTAIDQHQLAVHYQPKILLDSGEVTGVESLVRWPRSGSLVLPGQFIPQAEQSALMGPLTAWILHTAVEDYLQWRSLGLWVGVAVNLSARNLSDPELPDLLATLAELPGVDTADITLELTESAVIANRGRAGDLLSALRLHGYRISLDDFGTGQASLQLLRELPFTEVKIDRSFVQAMMVDPDDHAIVHAVIELGRALGIDVVAEGVQDQATLDRLSSYGCTYGQGYFLGRPAPAQELIAATTSPSATWRARRLPPLDDRRPSSAGSPWRSAGRPSGMRQRGAMLAPRVAPSASSGYPAPPSRRAADG